MIDDDELDAASFPVGECQSPATWILWYRCALSSWVQRGWRTSDDGVVVTTGGRGGYDRRGRPIDGLRQIRAAWTCIACRRASAGGIIMPENSDGFPITGRLERVALLRTRVLARGPSRAKVLPVSRWLESRHKRWRSQGGWQRAPSPTQRVEGTVQRSLHCSQHRGYGLHSGGTLLAARGIRVDHPDH